MDPVQQRANYLDGMKETLEITEDTEWSAISPKVGKVYDARRDMLASTMRGMMGGGRRGNRGGNGGNADDPNAGGRRQRANGFGEESSAVAALRKAIEDKAPTAEIKVKLKAVQDEQKDKLAKLTTAQEDLRAVLTPRQEGIATLNGLL